MAENVGGIYYDVTLETGEMVRKSRQAGRELGTLGTNFSQVAVAVKALAAAYALLRTARLADEIRLLSARVLVAAGSLDAAKTAMSELVRISTRTQTSVAANASVFQRLNSSIQQMGGTQQDTLRITELLGMAIKVSGAGAQEASSALLQFGQALGSGQLAGDELRSLLENAPYLMKQLADGLGVPIGALKSMGEAGELTADRVTQALAKAAGQIEADFERMPRTVAGALQVTGDAVGRLALVMDNFTGTSAALSGLITGLGEVLDALAEQFGMAGDNADELGRNNSVKSWAESTRNVLSFVVDAADFVTRGFQQMGTGLGALAASAAQLLQGNVANARQILGQGWQDVQEIGNRQFAGARMRESFRSQDGAPARQAAPLSALTAPGGPGAGRGGAGGREQKPFDAAGYIAALEMATKEGFARISAEEQEALRRNGELLAQYPKQRAAFERAAVLIAQNASAQRVALFEQENRDIEAAAERAAQEQLRAEREREQNRMAAQDLMAAGDPVKQLELRLQRESELLTLYAQQDLANAQLYAGAKVALTEQTAARVAAIRQREVDDERARGQMLVSIMGDSAGQLYALLESAGKERSALGKALFLTQKALAVAEILLNTEVAAAKAIALNPIVGPAMAVGIRAMGYASAGMVAGLAVAQVAGGRQYGGPVEAGSLYRINEGGRPEMFTAANGNQYMLPTKSGEVTAAHKVGGGGPSFTYAPVIHVNGDVSPQTIQAMRAEIAADRTRWMRQMSLRGSA